MTLEPYKSVTFLLYLKPRDKKILYFTSPEIITLTRRKEVGILLLSIKVTVFPSISYFRKHKLGFLK